MSIRPDSASRLSIKDWTCGTYSRNKNIYINALGRNLRARRSRNILICDKTQKLATDQRNRLPSRDRQKTNGILFYIEIFLRLPFMTCQNRSASQQRIKMRSTVTGHLQGRHSTDQNILFFGIISQIFPATELKYSIVNLTLNKRKC